MNLQKRSWQGDDGGVDFIQVIIGILIIAAAAVGTLQSLNWGYEKLDEQMRYRKALSIARSHVEYLQGLIHSELDKIERDIMVGTGNRPYTVLLDKRDPSIDYDDLYCRVEHSNIFHRYDLESALNHYEFRVTVRWDEPHTVTTGARPANSSREVILFATMSPNE